MKLGDLTDLQRLVLQMALAECRGIHSIGLLLTKDGLACPVPESISRNVRVLDRELPHGKWRQYIYEASIPANFEEPMLLNENALDSRATHKVIERVEVRIFREV